MKKIILALCLLFTVNLAFSIDLYWEPVYSNFEYNMNLTASLYIDDVEQQNEMLEIGVFSGEELRGSALPQISAITNKYVYSITIYGNQEGEELTFKFYDHSTEAVSELVCSQMLNFSVNGILGDANSPYNLFFSEPNITFIGDGSWNDASNWKNSKMPTTSDDVIIDGTAVVENGNDIRINSLLINDGKSLTIQDGAVFSVDGAISNDDVDGLIIEEGGQIFQNNDNVAATFKNEIVIPDGIWGQLDETGWQFVSSPMQNFSLTDFIPETGDYDLFKYDGTLEYQWYNFKKARLFDFDSDDEGWTTMDDDGDSHNWILADGYIYSESYDIDNEEELSPDNYLIFPMMDPEVDGNYLSFKACAEDDSYPEYCGVAVSLDGSNFTMLDNASWTIGEGLEEGLPSQWYEKVVDLSEYKGKDIYVAIRHYNVVGSYYLLIDDVKFFRNGGSFENGMAYLVSYETESVADFKGYLNNETSYKMKANYSADDVMTNYNLFGNPFTYNIDWKSDVKLAGVNEGYAIVKSDGGYEYKTEGTIKVGEGFMVNSSRGRTHNVTFQKGVNSTKNDEDDSYINIKAAGKFGVDNVIVSFGENDKLNFIKLDNFNDKIANIFVANNDTTYGIYNYNTDMNSVVIYFVANEIGSYSLTFDIDGKFEDVYLVDRMTGDKVNVLLEDRYDFIGSPTDMKDRFLLTKAGGSDISIDTDNFAYYDDGELIINRIEGDATISIFDAIGRCVYHNVCDGSCNRISTDGYASGVYVIRKTDGNGVKTQKFVAL